MEDVRGEEGLVIESGDREICSKLLFPGIANLTTPGRETGGGVVIKTHPGVGLLGKHQLRVHNASHVALHINPIRLSISSHCISTMACHSYLVEVTGT